MAINFPSSPSVDQVYTYNGLEYTWDGASWKSTYDGGSIVTPASVAAALASGDFLINKDLTLGSGTQVWQEVPGAADYKWNSGTGAGVTRMTLTNAGILDVSIKDQNDNTGLKLWSGTQAQYDAIGTPSSDVLYFIT